MRCPKSQLFCSFGSENVGIIGAEKNKFNGFPSVTRGLLCGSLIPDECFIINGPLSLFMQCHLQEKETVFPLTTPAQSPLLVHVWSFVPFVPQCVVISLPQISLSHLCTACDAACPSPSLLHSERRLLFYSGVGESDLRLLASSSVAFRRSWRLI